MPEIDNFRQHSGTEMQLRSIQSGERRRFVGLNGRNERARQVAFHTALLCDFSSTDREHAQGRFSAGKAKVRE